MVYFNFVEKLSEKAESMKFFLDLLEGLQSSRFLVL